MDIDLLGVANYAGSQPHEQFEWLRTHSPVHRHAEPDGPGFWAVTRFDDVREVGRDYHRFSSTPTIMIDDPSGDDAFGDRTMMLMADPPLHTRMRRLVSRRFAPPAVAELAPHIDELAADIVDRVVDAGRCDLVTDLAGEMPSFVIAELLGIPHDDGRRLYRHTEAIHASEEAIERDARVAAVMEMFAYSQHVYAARKAEPTDDLSSLLAHAEIDGTPNDEIDFFLWFLLLVDAGGDTTRNLIGAGMHALLGHPDQLELLLGDLDGRLDTAIEELLRWVSPVVYMRRTATADTELAGQPIREGDKVVMYYGSANRDAEVFEDADRFDITRDPNPHIAFGGGGRHYCMGAHLARVEIRALLRAILTRLCDIELAGDPTWMTSNFVFGPAAMPVTYRAVG